LVNQYPLVARKTPGDSEKMIKIMPIILRTALFGVTPATLLLGRACCLADCPPVGLYDQDPQAALMGALFLGLSARQEPQQLHSPESPLEVALVGSQQAWRALASLQAPSILAILLYEPAAEDRSEARGCWAVPDDTGPSDQALAITASMPPLTFALAGGLSARREGEAYLRSLSPDFRFR
jgi:hypothetical protein